MKTYVGNPAAARDYVEADRSRADDYYLAEGTGVARRFTAGPDGHVIELAPLAGDAYEAWVGGVDPDTGQARGRLRHDDRAVRFVEVTVNGPKSWSLAAELHPDIAAAYDAAQGGAAQQVIAWLAQHSTTRVGPRGGQVQVPVEQLEAATVRHHTSRAGDPHRHLHLQINARVFAAGQWRGLHTVGVRDSLNAINGIGHAAVLTDPTFRTALAAHGFTVDPGGEITQLAPYVGAFSKRADQIRRTLDRYERDWTATHPGQQSGPALRRAWDARAWAEARPDKVTPQPGADLNQRWLEELAELGYVDRDHPVAVVAVPVGGVDRDRAAAEILARLGAARSAWNAADIRGEAEQLLARTGIITAARVRSELAEDLTARALTRCVALLDRLGVPEHIRTLTSPHVLEVEADLVARLAARGDTPHHGVTRSGGAARSGGGTGTGLVRVAALRGLDRAQTTAAAALVGEHALVVVQGAAGAGKTTTLAAAGRVIADSGQAMVVVTPTLKAARVAATELGTNTGSAAWFAYQHGWRWNERGTWTRLTPGDRDPVTGRPVALPSPIARLRAGDLLVVDEAGMLDQDTARALLIVADEHHARLALIGDVHQLAAVGRGGVLELAERWTTCAVTLDGVHRFTRTTHDADGAEVTVPDTDYAELSLAMRRGEDPGAVFDQLHARGQVVVYPHPEDRTTHLATKAAKALKDGRRSAVVADTREQVRDLTAAIRAARIAAGQVTDPAAATTAIPLNPETPVTAATALARAAAVTAVVTVAGERIGVGDMVATRRNDRDLDVANRDTWTVTAITEDGRLRVTGAGGARTLPAGYVAEQVALAYACTVYGVQGDTTDTSDVVLSEHSSAASTYVAMTRGRQVNTVHIVADTLNDAREQWVAAFARDRTDLGPAAARANAEREAAAYAVPRPLETVLGELRQAWTEQDHCRTRLGHEVPTRDALREIVALRADHPAELAPLEAAHHQARQDASAAARRLEASTRAVTAHAERISAGLMADWDAQRPGARAAADVAQGGSGLLGWRLPAVNRATEDLARWSLTWQPYLPQMPTASADIAGHAGRSDDRSAIRAALQRYALAAAHRDHPDHPHLQAAAEETAAAQTRTGQALIDTRHTQDQHLSWYGSLGHSDDPVGRLARLEQAIPATQAELAAVDARIARLTGEPALLALPPDRLTAERAWWQAERDLHQEHLSARAADAAFARTGRDRIRPTPTPQPAPEREHGISR